METCGQTLVLGEEEVGLRHQGEVQRARRGERRNVPVQLDGELGQDVLPELVQHDANPERINEKIREMQIGSSRRDVVILELRKLKGILGQKKPSVEIPKIIDYLLRTYG